MITFFPAPHRTRFFIELYRKLINKEEKGNVKRMCCEVYNLMWFPPPPSVPTPEMRQRKSSSWKIIAIPSSNLFVLIRFRQKPQMILVFTLTSKPFCSEIKCNKKIAIRNLIYPQLMAEITRNICSLVWRAQVFRDIFLINSRIF